MTNTVNGATILLTGLVNHGGQTMPKRNPGNRPVSDESKRSAILNAAMAEFKSGYDKASTDAIVKAAGVSKGLLFHYFGSKKELFLYAYEYALQTVIHELYGLIDLENRDILNRMKQILVLKMDLMRKHPMIFDFISRASFPDSHDVSDTIKAYQNKLINEVYPKIFFDINRSLFRDGIDVDTAIRVIISTMRNYALDEVDPAKATADYIGEYDRYLQDLERIIALFRASFYK